MEDVEYGHELKHSLNVKWNVIFNIIFIRADAIITPKNGSAFKLNCSKQCIKNELMTKLNPQN